MSASDGKPRHESKNIIGYWMTEKKSQKLNWSEFSSVCRRHGYELVKINLDIPLEEQGPFTIIVHKLTDIIVKTFHNDEKSIRMIKNVEDYLERHKEVAVLDPLNNVRKLLDRSNSYITIRDSPLSKFGVFTPSFVELTSDDVNKNLQIIKNAGITFPFICKPSISHGSKDCHKMAVIFNEAGVKDCKPPCVAQSFVNHHALLFKVYIMREKYCVLERPSLKNFYPCDHRTIFFNSHDVSKPDSTSSLSILEPHEQDQRQFVHLDPVRVKSIVHMLKKVIGMSLIGIDIVIENGTNRYAIIDINSYPGYEGFPEFFETLISLIKETIDNHQKQLSKNNLMNSNSPSNFKIMHSPQDYINGSNFDNGLHSDDSEDNEDVLNSNKNNNTNVNNKNLIFENNDTNGTMISKTNSWSHSEDNELNQLQNNQRIRTVPIKKSIQRRL